MTLEFAACVQFWFALNDAGDHGASGASRSAALVNAAVGSVGLAAGGSGVATAAGLGAAAAAAAVYGRLVPEEQLAALGRGLAVINPGASSSSGSIGTHTPMDPQLINSSNNFDHSPPPLSPTNVNNRRK